MDAKRPLVLVEDEALLDELLRLAAAAGCELQRAPDVAGLRAGWSTAPLVLLDEAGAGRCAGAGLARRPGVLLVCSGDPPPEAWQVAVRAGAEHVLALPLAEELMVNAFADVVELPAQAIGRVLAVLGGRGGAGASVLAASVAHAVLRGGGRALLVDCDALGGGLDLVLGAEGDVGLRWPELALSGGRVSVASLRSALPGRRHGGGSLTVLSCDRDGPGPVAEAVAAVVEAGRRAGETVICDLPRHLPEPACAALDRADLAVMVVPAEVRACAAAKRVADRARERGVELFAVVRGPAPGGLAPEDVAAAAGVPLLNVMRPEPGLARALERGRVPARPRGPLVAAARVVLSALRSAGSERRS
jgi:secretion/DNA translocation related CpaE-like protein